MTFIRFNQMIAKKQVQDGNIKGFRRSLMPARTDIPRCGKRLRRGQNEQKTQKLGKRELSSLLKTALKISHPLNANR